MFLTFEPLEHVSSSIEINRANGFNQVPQVFIDPRQHFYVGLLANFDQLTVLIATNPALRENLLKSAEEPQLASLLYFSPADASSGVRTIHNIVNVWERYSIEGMKMQLLLEDDKHAMFGSAGGTENFLGQTLIWSLTSPKAFGMPARRSRMTCS